MESNQLGGLIAATYTPMDANGGLNLAAIRPYCQALIAQGAVRGVFICGTTGEGLSLTVSERTQLTEEWVAAAAGRLEVIVHAGHTSIEEARVLAAHAASAGADGVAAIGPVFFKPAGLRELVQYCAAIAEAADGARFYYYHIPVLTGLQFSMREFLIEASEVIPNLAGIKFTDGDLMEYQRCVEWCGGRYEMFFGRDEMLLAALALGAEGAVGSTYSYAAAIYADIMSAFRKGDMQTARDGQAASQRLVQILLRHGVIPSGKALLEMAGFPFGPPRMPLAPLSMEEADELRHVLEETGLLHMCLKQESSSFPGS